MPTWDFRGTYYDACNCEAICPCRDVGDREGGDTTYGTCDFVISWFIDAGWIDDVEVAGRAVVVAGRYADDEPGKPWRVVLYVDDRSNDEQHRALAELWPSSLPFSEAIAQVEEVRSAAIRLDHTPHAQSIVVEPFITVRTRESVEHEERVSSAIPGHDRAGTEVIADLNRVDDLDFTWQLHGRTGFATDFAYAS